MEPFIFKCTVSLEEKTQAQALITNEYRRVGYIQEKEVSSSLSDNLFLDSSTTFVAEREGVVYGTLSLFLDRSGGLPMEQEWKEELSSFRDKGCLLAEAGQFAVEHTQPLPIRLQIVSGLFALLLKEARDRKIEILCIAVHAKHRPFYESLGFTSLGEPRFYGPVRVEQAVGMSLEVDDSLVTRLHLSRLPQSPGR